MSKVKVEVPNGMKPKFRGKNIYRKSKNGFELRLSSRFVEGYVSINQSYSNGQLCAGIGYRKWSTMFLDWQSPWQDENYQDYWHEMELNRYGLDIWFQIFTLQAGLTILPVSTREFFKYVRNEETV